MFGLSVAFDENKGIGINGSLPWHIKDELQLFRKNTLHQNIIMGRTTFENLPGKLNNRKIFVVSSQKDYHPDDATVIDDFQKFLLSHTNDDETYIICGGKSIYKQAYPYCDFAYLSIIKGVYPTDTSFDTFEFSDWNVIEEKIYDQFTFYKLKRK